MKFRVELEYGNGEIENYEQKAENFFEMAKMANSITRKTTKIKSIVEIPEVENELDSGLPLLIDETIKGIKVEDGKLLIGFESGIVTELSKRTLADNTDGWVY